MPVQDRHSRRRPVEIRQSAIGSRQIGSGLAPTAIPDCRSRPLRAACASPAWWPWQGDQTRSHSELGRQTPQRPWYCVPKTRESRSPPGPQSTDRSGTRDPDRKPPSATKNPIPKPTSHRHTRPFSSPKPQQRHRETPGRPAPAGRLRHPTAGWSSPVARQAHNLKVAGSNPAPATKLEACATAYTPFGAAYRASCFSSPIPR